MKKLGLFVLLLLVVVQAVFSDEDAAFEANRRGLELVIHAKNQELAALPLFLEANELSQFRNVEYLNNLGVTYMRLGLSHLALKFLQEAKRIDYKNANKQTDMNLDLIYKQYLPHKTADVDKLPVNERKHKTLDFVRITKEQFVEKETEYLKRPFILVNFTTELKYDKLLNLLEGNYQNTFIDYYSNNMYLESARPRLVPMKYAFQDLKQSSNSTRCKYKRGSYLHFNLDQTQWNAFSTVLDETYSNLPDYFKAPNVWLNDCFPDPNMRSKFQKESHWRMLLIGNHKAGMFNHLDTLRTASWQVQLLNKKKWHVCSEKEIKNLGSKAGVVDAFNPDYDNPNHNLINTKECYFGTVHQNELIYYPKDYYHQTEVVAIGDTFSIALTDTLIDQDNVFDVIAEMLFECRATTQKRIGFSKEICAHLQGTCYKKLLQRYGAIDSSASNVCASP